MVVLALAGVLSNGCSVKKNTITSRMYHKTTAHYNGYFNARERVKQGAKTLSVAQVDRYDRILSVFKYGDPTLAKSVFPDMDEAIKKVSTVIQRHSMEIDGKERNKWIDDCYLLIGVAQFYKHETWTAIESFQFVAAQYRNEPIKYDALMWLTQCYLRLGKMPDADYLMSTFRDDAKFPVKQKGLYNAIYADYYLLQNDYEKAIEHLTKAAAMSKKRSDRIRYNFILGQIYQKQGEYKKAVNSYEACMKLNPPYEMMFNARVNRARCIDVNSPDAKGIREMLVKMLTDDKNQEYLDQIYYALAEISLKENNTEEAISFLRKSTASSVGNSNQKALSYLKLAEIYFKKPEYQLAQTYYDSTAAFLSQDHPDYIAIINTKTNLTKLIKNLNVIQVEDSLQRLAALSAAEREAAIDKLIDTETAEKLRIEEEKEQKLKEAKEMKEQSTGDPFFNQQDMRPPSNATSGGGQQGSGWYFSNQSAISFGYNEFIRIWGNRKLEDNWRRSSRSTFAEGSQSGEGELPGEENDSLDLANKAIRDSIMALDNSKRRKAYLEAIPVTSEMKAKSDEKIVEAYYNVGLIYKEQLRDNKESGRNFETLLQRYPENQYKIPTVYNLYRVYLALGDEEKSDYYKNIILNSYPESEYAKIILNPDYFKDQQKKVAIQKVFYENTYRAYLNKQYQDVIDRKEMADSLFPSSELAPKYELLRSMAIGKLRPLPEFEASLKAVVTRFPEDSVAIRAKEILAHLNPAAAEPAVKDTSAPKSEVPEMVTPPKKKAIFAFSPDTIQYIIFVYVNNTISTEDFKVALSNFNTKYHSAKGLTVNNSFLGQQYQFLMVKQHNNKEAALEYLDGLLSDPEAFAEIDLPSARSMVITPDNLIMLLQTKDIEGYEKFYEEQYLN